MTVLLVGCWSAEQARQHALQPCAARGHPSRQATTRVLARVYGVEGIGIAQIVAGHGAGSVLRFVLPRYQRRRAVSTARAYDFAYRNRPAHMQSLSTQPADALTAVEQSIVEMIAAGSRIKEAAEDHGLTEQRLLRLRQKNPALDRAVLLACARKQIALVERMEEIAATEPDVQRARLICDNIKWTASKLNAKVFGDRLAVDVDVKVDLGGALAAAKARALRPMSDLTPVLDVEFEALPSPQDVRTPDSQSDSTQTPTPAEPGETPQGGASLEPDIFS